MTAAPLRYVREHWADPLYRQSYLMLASTAVSAATGLLFWVLAARRATPEVMGVVAGMVAAIAFLSYLTSFALPYAMLRFGGSARPVASMLNASLLFSAVTSLLAAGLFAVVSPVTSPALAPLLRGPVDIAFFGLAGVGAAAAVLLDNLLAARHRAGTVLVRNTAAGLLRLLLLALAAPDDPRALYLAASLPPLMTGLAVLAGLPRLLAGYRLRELRLDAPVREAAAFALRTYPGSLLSGAPQFALPIVAVSLLSPGENAFFYVAWSIAQIAYLIPTVISNITLSQGPGAPDSGLARRSLRFSLVLLVPAGVLGIGLAEFVLGFYGAAYAQGAAVPLRLLMAAALPWAVVIIAQAQLRIQHRFLAVTALTGTLCAASLGLPVALAPAFGIAGMAAGWLLSILAAAALAWRLWTARAAPSAHTRPVALLAVAALCAGTVVAGPLAPGGGAVATAVTAARFVAGLALSCYLPGRLAAGLLHPDRRGGGPGPARGQSGDGLTGAVLTAALSLAATMLVGLLVAAAGRRVDAVGVATGQLVVCALLAAGWFARAQRGGSPAADPSTPELPPPPPRHLSTGRLLAAVPAVVLTAVLVGQVVVASRHRTSDSYYTELAVERTGSGVPVVVVRSREQLPTDFRLEQSVAGRTVAMTEFSLRPGEAAEFAVTGRPARRVEARLYRAAETVVYRHVTVWPG